MDNMSSLRNISRKYFPYYCFALILILGLLCILFYRLGIQRMVSSTKEAYASSSTEAYNNTYESYYKNGESSYHVSTRADITIQNIREVENLEVLQVSNTVVIPNSNGEIWSEITGSTNYIVNLRLAEYVIDNTHQYILVRVPNPKLSEEIKIDKDNWNIYKFLSDGFIEDITTSMREGSDDAINVVQQANSQILNNLKNNQDYPEYAKKSAELIIKSLINGINPDIENLSIDVEFV